MGNHFLTKKNISDNKNHLKNCQLKMLRTPLHALRKSKSGLQPNMTIQRHISNSESYFEYLLFFFSLKPTIHNGA